MKNGAPDLAERLMSCEEPSIRLRATTDCRSRERDTSSLRARSADSDVGELAEMIRRSDRVQALLVARETDGRLRPVRHVYQKWFGAHWVLLDLAELRYPPEDRDLESIRDQVYETWLADEYQQTFEYSTKSQAYKREGVPMAHGRARRCASQQGAALLSTIALGIADERAHDLARLLIIWQWPDGGWNCDKNPDTHTSSFHETLLPMRGLTAYSRWAGAAPAMATRAAEAARDAAEVFLTRNLFRRRSDGAVMSESFLKLAYPRYWHYDILGGLVAMMDLGLLDDPRCGEALDALEAMELPDGGWAAPNKFWRFTAQADPKGGSGLSRVRWGPAGTTRMNPWVTVETLMVLYAAGRR